MRVFTRIIITFIIIFTLGFAYAETKTEEAHNKLKNAGSYEEQEHTNSHHWQDEEEDDFWEVISYYWFCLSFNFNPFGGEPGFALQRVRYNPQPYNYMRSQGHRNSVSNRYTLLNLDTAYGTGITEDTQSILSQAKWNFGSFALNFKYKLIDEDDAPYKISYYSIMLERKSAVLPFFDAGFSSGYDKIGFGDDYYEGFSLGYNLEIYPLRPFSLKFQPGIMFHKDITIIDVISELRIHHGHLYIGFGHNYFDIDSTIFRSLMFHIGVFF
ncbi:MAG: hypothetical protein K9N06_00140 [Candidatus Cloacimonetes bacterium]|nr:hypothetical protein [Candidatus Cloacimonadota bacterium]